MSCVNTSFSAAVLLHLKTSSSRKDKSLPFLRALFVALAPLIARDRSFLLFSSPIAEFLRGSIDTDS